VISLRWCLTCESRYCDCGAATNALPLLPAEPEGSTAEPTVVQNGTSSTSGQSITEPGDADSGKGGSSATTGDGDSIVEKHRALIASTVAASAAVVCVAVAVVIVVRRRRRPATTPLPLPLPLPTLTTVAVGDDKHQHHARFPAPVGRQQGRRARRSVHVAGVGASEAAALHDSGVMWRYSVDGHSSAVGTGAKTRRRWRGKTGRKSRAARKPVSRASL
jgi:hypothetical protein